MTTKTRGSILAVVGAQYGSEGKGVIVNSVAHLYDVHVRVGGPNAGHSFVHADKVWKMQVIPCGWANPDATLVLGRGMLLDPKQLAIEIEAIRLVDSSIMQRLRIDRRIGMLEDWHHTEEGGVHGQLHQRIGSTGEGVGAARAARMSRDPSRFRFAHEAAGQYGGPDWELGDLLCDDTAVIIAQARYAGRDILFEGTQGAGLSLIHGPWPFVTSADTNAAQMAADVGIPPRWVNRTILVARTMPIRVAGNSGPLKDEVTWEEVSRRVGKPVKEQTTVTKKTRRIGEWDDQLVIQACRLNAPTSMAVTFIDYISPKDEGVKRYDDLSPDAKAFITYVETLTHTQVNLIGTGGPKWTVINRGRTL